MLLLFWGNHILYPGDLHNILIIIRSCDSISSEFILVPVEFSSVPSSWPSDRGRWFWWPAPTTCKTRAVHLPPSPRASRIFTPPATWKACARSVCRCHPISILADAASSMKGGHGKSPIEVFSADGGFATFDDRRVHEIFYRCKSLQIHLLFTCNSCVPVLFLVHLCIVLDSLLTGNQLEAWQISLLSHGRTEAIMRIIRLICFPVTLAHISEINVSAQSDR